MKKEAIEFIKKHINVNIESLKDEDILSENGIDSLHVVVIAMEIEKELNIEIPYTQLENCKTFK